VVEAVAIILALPFMTELKKAKITGSDEISLHVETTRLKSKDNELLQSIYRFMSESEGSEMWTVKMQKKCKTKKTFNSTLELLAQSPFKHYCKPCSVTKDCGEKVRCSCKRSL